MDEFAQFMKDFYRISGIDLELYKRPQMERRLTFLRNKHNLSSFTEFLNAVTKDSSLMHELLDRMTINVSEFFRNPERWDALIPFVEKLSTTGRPAKIWSAACSTGEEPYTLAILFEERLKRAYEILATDIDRKVLQSAKDGRYREHQVKSVSPDIYRKYFTQQEDWHVVRPELKQHIKFDLHNLLADSYPTGMDLIVCRNVLIYFTDAAKHQVISGFAKALNPGGLLFVGSTEQFLTTDKFELENVAPFLYQRRH